MDLAFRKLALAICLAGASILTWPGVSRAEVVVFDRVNLK